MPLRTASLFAALGQEGALDVLIALLRDSSGSGVGGLVRAVALPQATVTRRLQELEAAGLLDHERRGQPFRLRERERVRALLSDASELSERLLALDTAAERTFRDRLPQAPD